MPYKPTGRPPGRPRKSDAAAVETLPVASPAPKKTVLKRLHAGFRRAAAFLNGEEGPRVFDSRGRPRERVPRRYRHMA